MKVFRLTLCLIFFGLLSHAQDQFMLYNFAGLPQSTEVNLSSLPNNRWHIGLPVLSTFRGSIYNSGFTYNQLFVRGADDSVRFDLGNAAKAMEDKNQLLLQMNTDWLSFGLRMKRSYIYASISEHVNGQFAYPKGLASLLWNGNGMNMGQPQELGMQLNASHYRSLNLYYARQINPDLTIGLRVRRLYGMENISMKNGSVTLSTDPQTFDLTASSNIDLQASGLDKVDLSRANIMNYFLKKGNNGWGMDLGASYRLKDRWLFSASVVNLGYIRWVDQTHRFTSRNPGASYTFSGVPLSQVIGDTSTINKAFNATLDSLKQSFGLAESRGSYSTTLSPQVFLSSRFMFNEFHYVSLTLQGRNDYGIKTGAVSVGYNVPLTGSLDVGVNYSISNRSYNNLGVGLVSWGANNSFYIMTDNLLGIIRYGNTKSINFRIGINIYGGKVFINDDRDDDLIPDKEDRCPGVAGPTELGGCPDRDGDKIIDIEDDCPDEPGSKGLNGCPDKDGDGIMDKYDVCPDVAGEAAFKGCPDRDHDGIPDSEDRCPIDPGTEQLKGCPDKDNDGIGDSDDACPEQPGPLDNRGCPTDRDNDGVADTEDHCPDQPGDAERKGCPKEDTDQDGLEDADDACVYTPGPKENKGCPVLSDTDQELFRKTATEILFIEPGAELNATSYSPLEELARWLEAHPAALLLVSAHTDSEGPQNEKLTLSKERAEAVRQFLISKSINPLRVSTEYFGGTKPIADNNTPEGRLRNNRVELSVKFK